MTREEAISGLQACVDAWDKWMLPGCSSLDKYKEAVKMGLVALRGPTREQVRAIKREWEKVDHLDYGELAFDTLRCGECEYEENIDPEEKRPNFCPNCGSPMTKKAWLSCSRDWRR